MKNKKSFLLITNIILILVLNSLLYSQISKPQYLVRAERADTTIGEFTIELFSGIAPLHTAYFDSLVNISFYDSLAFHRIVPDFVVQGGDPNSLNKPRETWGEGDSTQATILAEFSGVSHQRGIIGAARDEDINSANSQFYINVADNNFLDWNYTAFGKVLTGMEIVDTIVNAPRDANDNPNEKIIMFITKIGESLLIPEAPQNLFPDNEKVGMLQYDTLRWDNLSDAVQYHIELTKDSNFDSVDFTEKVGFNYFVLPEIALGSIKYYWRIKSDNGGNKSEYSEIQTFYTSIKAPILISPITNPDSISITPTFSWEAVDGAAGYRIQISNSPLFQDRYIVIDIDTIKNTTFTSPALQPNKSHYWRVFSLTEEYQGPVSESRRFVTPDVTGIKIVNNEIPNKFDIKQNFPNPFNPTTRINFDIPINSDVNLVLYNNLGEKVFDLLNENLASGSYSIELNGKNLSSGIYYLSIYTEKFNKTIKMNLLK
jgi:peptidyl-prolyl cis-trans isomerase B (cyclophilin B)